MLSKSAAKAFFLWGTAISSLSFVFLTLDTIKRVPAQTHEENINEYVARGKDLWDRNNCMGCHTLLGEGAYYAPELTKVYKRRGEQFIRAMLKDPESMYPGQRKMINYHFNDQEISDLVAFLKWVSEMDVNGFPAKPDLVSSAGSSGETATVTSTSQKARPAIVSQMCVACHSIGGQGGSIGPALDGVGSRRDKEYIARWLADPNAVKPGTKMPKLPLSKDDIAELTSFLSELKAPGGAQ